MSPVYHLLLTQTGYLLWAAPALGPFVCSNLLRAHHVSTGKAVAPHFTFKGSSAERLGTGDFGVTES